MATVYFPSLTNGDVVKVEFLKPDGTAVSITLLVDSGFTGQSCFVLAATAIDLVHAAAPTSRTTGALQGMQTRALVMCRISALAFQKPLIAIFADLTPLSLPPGIEGLAGLRFLRQFLRRGAEQAGNGTWRFYVSDDQATP